MKPRAARLKFFEKSIGSGSPQAKLPQKDLIMDYSKLRGLIREKLGVEKSLAYRIGMSTVSLSQKLGNKVEFTQSQILNICEVLNIPKEQIHVFFFDKGV